MVLGPWSFALALRLLRGGLPGAVVVALAAQHAVKIVNFAFAPSSVTVQVGDTVQWTNGDATTHTATADDGSWDTGNIAGGTRASVTFKTAGTFAYHCAIHSTMHGTVVVEAAAASQPPRATQAPAGGPPATDADARVSSPDATPGVIEFLALATAAVVGLELGRRRFRRNDPNN